MSSPAGPRFVVRHLGNETVVYDRQHHRAHCLGRLAAAVWRGEPVGGLATEVARRRLERAGLAAKAARPTGPARKGRLPVDPAERRRALRRVAGLAALAVASVLAPTPQAAAATCLTNGAASPCIRNADCCSTCCSSTQRFCIGGGTCLP
jgi:hypothetical protein